jgi:stage III sporulation protein AD
MTEVLRSVGFALVIAFLAMILREIGFRGASLICVLGAICLFGLAVGGMGQIRDELYSLSLTSGTEELFGSVLLIVGVSYLFSFAAELCRGIGEGTVASALELFGRVEIIVMALPALREIMKMAEEIIKSG